MSEFTLSNAISMTTNPQRGRPPTTKEDARGVAFAFDYDGSTVCRWSRPEDGVECERDESYTPSFYVSTESGAIDDLRGHLSMWPDVEGTAVEEWRRGFRHDPERVLRVDVGGIKKVREVASEVRGWGSPGEYRLYNVDFSREFRYCLETDTEPAPAAELTTMEIAIEPTQLADGDVNEIIINDKQFTGNPVFNLKCARDAARMIDPDVLIVNTSELVASLDADDHWLPDKLDKQIAVITAGADVVYSNVYLFEDGDAVPEKVVAEQEYFGVPSVRVQNTAYIGRVALSA